MAIKNLFIQIWAIVRFFFRFHFNRKMAGCVGVEIEFFLVGSDGVPVPRAPDFLRLVNDAAWTYELSCCQVEVRTTPCRERKELKRQLKRRIRQGQRLAQRMGLTLVAKEAWTGEIPLINYPVPRYDAICAAMPWPQLNAACRLTGVHVHIGVGSWYQALVVYRRLVVYLSYFLRVGDHSGGGRIALFQILHAHLDPPPFRTRFAVLLDAIRKGWVMDFGKCWAWVRISRHGTVEVRAFGSSDDVDEIAGWARLIQKIAHGEAISESSEACHPARVGGRKAA